ncbi:hypothetical protein [Vibrio mediterranei]|uniref:hypothetical protein n=1 Tax=Vibrio mediterranei TaxID=689 RepID=UPI004067C429
MKYQPQAWGILMMSLFVSATSVAKVTYEDALADNAAAKAKHEAWFAEYSKPENNQPLKVDENPTASDTPIIYNGVSGTSCTNVRPPTGTSVRTHDVYINGVYEDQTNHEASHTRGVAQQLTHDGDTRICAAYTSARHYNFTYEIKAFRK